MKNLVPFSAKTQISEDFGWFESECKGTAGATKVRKVFTTPRQFNILQTATHCTSASRVTESLCADYARTLANHH